MNFKAIVIIGATASGKTSLAHKIFQHFLDAEIECEIVNLDAFQIYQELSIGTAKPDRKEQKHYHYHGIDLYKINESVDANTFSQFLHKTCHDIYHKGKLPICVGGSGLYCRAFLHGLDPFPTHDKNVRAQIRQYASEYGWEKCYQKLKEIDPVRAMELHFNDHVRIERALEIYEICKIPPSQIQTKKDPLYQQSCLFDAFMIQTELEQEELRRNILIRTQELFQKGWIQEVQNLYDKYGDELKKFNSMRAIGYKTILDNITNQNSLEPYELIQKIVSETAQYAKRQKTWNKKEKIDCVLNQNNDQKLENLIHCLKNWY